MSETTRHDEIQGKIVHEYDGIEEADNELPRWWLAIFYLSMIFAVGYWFFYEEFHVGPSAAEHYAMQMEEIAKKGGGVNEQALAMLAQDPDAVAKGKAEFQTTCAACHMPEGQGNIGPNLTDNQWLHGGSAIEIYKTIEAGVVEKGMPAWGPVLGPDKTKKVTAFILSIRNTNVAGKAPEGEAYSP